MTVREVDFSISGKFDRLSDEYRRDAASRFEARFSDLGVSAEEARATNPAGYDLALARAEGAAETRARAVVLLEYARALGASRGQTADIVDIALENMNEPIRRTAERVAGYLASAQA